MWFRIIRASSEWPVYDQRRHRVDSQLKYPEPTRCRRRHGFPALWKLDKARITTPEVTQTNRLRSVSHYYRFGFTELALNVSVSAESVNVEH